METKKMIIPQNWGIEQLTGYKPQTTFWSDFAVAEAFDENAIRDTYERVKKEWKDNVVYVAELYIVLNHKIWAYYDLHNAMKEDVYDRYARLYNELWNDYGMFVDGLDMSDEDRRYFYDVTD